MDARLQMLALSAIEDNLHAAVTELERAPGHVELQARVESLRALRLRVIRDNE